MRLACLIVAALAFSVVPAETFHPAAGDLERAVLDLTRAIVREDVEAAREAMRRIRALEPRRFEADPRPQLPGNIGAIERAFHLTVDAAHAAVDRGDFEDLLSQQRWIITACGRCHTEARRLGQLPAGPLGRTP